MVLGTADAAKWVSRQKNRLAQPRATISTSMTAGRCGRPTAEAAERRLEAGYLLRLQIARRWICGFRGVGGFVLIKGPKGPEPALVSLISLTMVVVVATAAAAVGSSEAPRGHHDSRSRRALAGLARRRRRAEEMTGDTGRVLARSLVNALIRAAGHGSRK